WLCFAAAQDVAGRMRLGQDLCSATIWMRTAGADPADAAVHDSQKLDDVLDLSHTGKKVWADRAYRSVQIEAGLKERGLQSRIHRRAARNRPLSERQKSANLRGR